MTVIHPVRPEPPESLVQIADRFEPAPGLERWFREYFINSDARYFNPDHEHLQQAKLGVLWTNVQQSRGDNIVAGTAEIPRYQGAKWQRARQRCQIIDWFGLEPDFIITISSWYWRNVDVWSSMATSEHELYHCGQAKGDYGDLKYRKDDSPVYHLKPHDAEEHVGVVRRYGAGSAAAGVAQLVEAAMLPPEIAPAENVGFCGTCKRMINPRSRND